MAASNDFKFCSICRCNQNRGRKHIYTKKHVDNLQKILQKYGKKIDEAKRTIKTPSVVDGELEPDSTFWCHFCGIQVIKHMTDRNTSVQFGGVFEHLASADHQKNTNCWWTENGADKKDKNKFVLSQHDLHKFKEAVKENLKKLEKEVESKYDKASLSIKEKEEIQKKIAEEPPIPYIPPPTTYRTVRNHLGILQNPTGCHEGQRVWGGGIVKYRIGSDQWFPWEFDIDDGRKTYGYPSNSHSSCFAESRKSGDNKVMNNEDNIHTGATPPWLMADEDVQDCGVIGPSLTEFHKHVERMKKRGKNPNRIGANFDRETEVNSEWLPSFGGVWNAGPRWQTRRNFESRKEAGEKR